MKRGSLGFNPGCLEPWGDAPAPARLQQGGDRASRRNPLALLLWGAMAPRVRSFMRVWPGQATRSPLASVSPPEVAKVMQEWERIREREVRRAPGKVPPETRHPEGGAWLWERVSAGEEPPEPG